jgi:hypothetical protein
MFQMQMSTAKLEPHVHQSTTYFSAAVVRPSVSAVWPRIGSLCFRARCGDVAPNFLFASEDAHLQTPVQCRAVCYKVVQNFDYEASGQFAMVSKSTSTEARRPLLSAIDSPYKLTNL